MSENREREVDLLEYLRILASKWKLALGLFAGVAAVVFSVYLLANAGKSMISVRYSPVYYAPGQEREYLGFLTNQDNYLRKTTGTRIHIAINPIDPALPHMGAFDSYFYLRKGDPAEKLAAIRRTADKLFLFYIGLNAGSVRFAYADQNSRIVNMLQFIRTYEAEDVPALGAESLLLGGQSIGEAVNGIRNTNNCLLDTQEMFLYLSSLSLSERQNALRNLDRLYRKQFEMNAKFIDRETHVSQAVNEALAGDGAGFDETYARITNLNPAYAGLYVNYAVALSNVSVRRNGLLTLSSAVKYAALSAVLGLLVALAAIYGIELFRKI